MGRVQFDHVKATERSHLNGRNKLCLDLVHRSAINRARNGIVC